MLQNDTLLILLAKYPTPGQVKTRIATSVGNEQASNIQRTMLTHLTSSLRSPSYDFIAFIKQESNLVQFGQEFGFAPHEVLLQKEGSLGEKIHEAIRYGLQSYKKVLIIGSDTPEISSQEIEHASNLLTSYDCIIGPAYDGGYWLLGTTLSLQEIVQSITYSTDTVYEETVTGIVDKGYSYADLDKKHDIDTIDEWHALQERIAFDG